MSLRHSEMTDRIGIQLDWGKKLEEGNKLEAVSKNFYLLSFTTVKGSWKVGMWLEDEYLDLGVMSESPHQSVWYVVNF